MERSEGSEHAQKKSGSPLFRSAQTPLSVFGLHLGTRLTKLLEISTPKYQEMRESGAALTVRAHGSSAMNTISFPEPANSLRRMLDENDLIGYLKCNTIQYNTIQ